jgi:hypothetical protein
LSVSPWKRPSRILISLALLCISWSAFGQTFDQLVGTYAQKKSPVCVTYGHVLAYAETNPAAITKMCRNVFGGWMVDFPDGRRTYVAQADLDKSLADEWLFGEPGNLLNVVTLALCLRTGGYNRETGMLDYGKNDAAKYLGGGTWTGYDATFDDEHNLARGFERLVREARPDGLLKTAATIGFGDLAADAQKYKLCSGHDFSISGYNAANKCARLRNPFNPKEVLEVPVAYLLKIPCGMDFLEEKAS